MSRVPVDERTDYSAAADAARTEFLKELHLYFRGEKRESVVILAGCVALTAGALALLNPEPPQPFARGLAGTLLLTAAVGGVVGGTIVLRTDRQVAGLTRLHADDRDRFAAVEGERVRKVVRSFRTYRIGYSLITIGALAALVGTERPMVEGVATGLLLFAALGFVVDHFAGARAVRYEEQVLAQGTRR